MKISVFSVYDSKTDAFMQPIFLQTKPAAIRAITDCVQDPTHQFAAHPEDYTLFYLGQFDDSNGTFDLEKTPISLCVCIELLSDNNVSQLQRIGS